MSAAASMTIADNFLTDPTCWRASGRPRAHVTGRAAASAASRWLKHAAIPAATVPGWPPLSPGCLRPGWPWGGFSNGTLWSSSVGRGSWLALRPRPCLGIGGPRMAMKPQPQCCGGFQPSRARALHARMPCSPAPGARACGREPVTLANLAPRRAWSFAGAILASLVDPRRGMPRTGARECPALRRPSVGVTHVACWLC